jgi:hypothetical protein
MIRKTLARPCYFEWLCPSYVRVDFYAAYIDRKAAIAAYVYIHKQRYVYLAIMYSIYGGVAEYPVNIDLAVDVAPG